MALKLWCFVLCACACLQLQGALIQATDDGVDPEALQYLLDLSARQRGGTPGDSNLLPNDSDGFANTVHCFLERQHYGGEGEGLPTSGGDIRELHYNTSGMKAGDQLVETRLVLKLYTEPTECNISLYEMVDGERQLRDWKIATQQSIEFTIHRAGEHSSTRNYYLILEVIQQSTEYSHNIVLSNAKAMLIVYTYNNETARSLMRPLPTVQKRETQDNTVLNNPTLTDLRGQFCQKRKVNLTWEQLGWPGSSFSVIQPQRPAFDFCHGHCTSPLGALANYTNHSRIQAIYHLSDSSIPPPCCAPRDLVIQTIVYGLKDDTQHLAITCSQTISNCKCQ